MSEKNGISVGIVFLIQKVFPVERGPNKKKLFFIRVVEDQLPESDIFEPLFANL